MSEPRGETAPIALVFDVNETLIDLEYLTPLFARLFGNGGVMREWFTHMILYSQSITLGGAYVPLNRLGGATLKMLGKAKGVAITAADIEELGDRTGSMPAHPDVAPALRALRDAGFRLATLTNSPPRPDGGPLRKSGLEPYFEHCISVDAVGRFKTAPDTYRAATEALGIAPSQMCLIACHAWDCLGAQLFGAASGLVLRPGSAAFPVEGLPPPTIVEHDMRELAAAITKRWR